MNDQSYSSFCFGEGDFRVSRPGGLPDTQIFNSKLYLKDGALTVYRIDDTMQPAMPRMVFAPGCWKEVDKVKDSQTQRAPDQVQAGKAEELFQMIAKALPDQGGREKGYRDGLESIVLALSDKVMPHTLREAVTTALDAYANDVGDDDADSSALIQRERG